jgi:hypothetical protein
MNSIRTNTIKPNAKPLFLYAGIKFYFYNTKKREHIAPFYLKLLLINQF